MQFLSMQIAHGPSTMFYGISPLRKKCQSSMLKYYEKLYFTHFSRVIHRSCVLGNAIVKAYTNIFDALQLIPLVDPPVSLGCFLFLDIFSQGSAGGVSHLSSKATITSRTRV